jgi:LysM repeat protein
VACGDDAETTATTAVQIGATNYVTIPPTPSTEAPPVTTGGPQPEQAYTIEAGDLPVTIASKFNVAFADLMALNEWVLEGQFVTNFPPVGTVIRIPAGGTLPGETLPPEPETAAPTDETTTETTAAPATTLAGGGDNCEPGSYVILAEDTSRQRVADKFDVTVVALDAANAGTAGYAAFYPGLTIVIPAKTDC